jgi:hypothetical protein
VDAGVDSFYAITMIIAFRIWLKDSLGLGLWDTEYGKEEENSAVMLCHRMMRGGDAPDFRSRVGRLELYIATSHRKYMPAI